MLCAAGELGGPMTNDSNIIFGVNPILERIKASSSDIQEVLLSDSADGRAVRVIKSEAARLGLRVQFVATKALDRLVGNQRHQGVVARVEPYNYLTLEAVLEELSAASAPQRVLLLDSLTDPRNFGALLRTAEAVGLRYVIIPKDRSVDVTPVVVKASAGATHHLKIAKVTNLRRAISALKEIGYWIAGLDAQSQELIYQRSYPEKLAIVLGSEGKGIRPVILGECDFTVAIPMMGKIPSLNVAVAGAVFFYEVLRQTRNVDKKSAIHY
jgi:23S rRNA (guanosine2251-2'-O)-methyltransferase